MKEDIERRSFAQRVFPPISKEEDAKTFSWQRAKRGAKIGATIGAGMVLVPGAVGLSVKDISSSEVVQFIELTIMHALFWGSFGAGLDGFKPTSRAAGKVFWLERGIGKATSRVINKWRSK